MDVIGVLMSIKIPSKKHLKCQILLSNLFQKGRSESNNKCAPIQRLRKKNMHMHEHIIKWKEDIVHSCKLSIIEAASCTRLLTGTHALYMTEYNP